ncbi:MAG: CHAT domain-containing protein [Caldilineaceae bacterium]
MAAWTKATALLFNGRAPDALPYYRRAETIYSELDQPIEQVGVQAPLVYALNAAGEPTAALHLAQQVQTHCHHLGEPARLALAQVEMNIGTIRKQQGAFTESLAACDRAKALFTALNDPEGTARAEMNRANVLQEMDRFTEAAAAYVAARGPLIASQRNRQQVALIDFNLGLLAERRGRFQEALHYLEAARNGFTPVVHQAAADLNRALIYNRLNLSAEARQLAQSTQAIFAAHEMGWDEGQSLLVLGIAEQRLGHYAEASGHLEGAIEIFMGRQAEFWRTTAQLALAECNFNRSSHHDTHQHWAECRELTNRAKIRADQAGWPTLAVEARILLAHMALTLMSPPPHQTITWLHESIAIAEQYHLVVHQLESYAALGRAYRQQQCPTHAWTAYRRAISLLESVRATLQIDELQLGYLADKAGIYEEAAQLFCPDSATTDDHAILLYLLNLAAVAPLPTPVVDDENPAVDALLAELHTLQELRHWQQHKITDPTTPLDATRTALGRLEHQISDCWRRLHVQRQGRRTHLADSESTTGNSAVAPPDQSDPLALDTSAQTQYRALQATLRPHDALIVYAKIGDRIVALLLRTSTSLLIPLESYPAVEQRVRAWRFHINDQRLIQHQPMLAQPLAQRILAAFHQALFAPLLPHLAGCTHLYVTLPAPLHDLPVAAFWNGEYLLERYQLTHLSAPAARLSAHQPQEAEADGQASLIIGHSHHGEVVQATMEATQVATTMAQLGRCTLLVEDAATAGAVLDAAPTASLIHMAAHAHFAHTGPLFSAIHLADRELTLIELYHGAQLRRRPLVVLSTCVSGQGAARGGGILGLSRAFFAAGAGQLIVATWRVDDEATAALMNTFYTTLTTHSDCRQAGAALCHAQRQLAQTHHPFYWAGFLHMQG